MTQVAAARALGLQAAADWDAGEHGPLGPSRAKLFASEIAVRVTERAQHVHGGYGQMSEFDIGRYVRDARMGPVGGGVSEIQARIVARAIGLPVSGRPGRRPDTGSRQAAT
jgi:alkylation response protein AidB-like acyl-CoA dehydrogenase